MSQICEVFPVPVLMQWARPLLRCIHPIAESQVAVSEFTPSHLIRIGVLMAVNLQAPLNPTGYPFGVAEIVCNELCMA